MTANIPRWNLQLLDGETFVRLACVDDVFKERAALTAERDALKAELATLKAKPELPDPGEGWRLLEKGEVVIEGDEVFQVGGWHRSANVGFGQSPVCPHYRRRLPPAAKAPPVDPWASVAIPEGYRVVNENDVVPIGSVWQSRDGAIVETLQPWSLLIGRKAGSTCVGPCNRLLRPTHRVPTAADVEREWEVRDYETCEWKKRIGVAARPENSKGRFITVTSEGFTNAWRFARIPND